MIKSTFIASIIDLLLDVDGDGLALRKQIPYLSENEHDFTGSGVFVSFLHEDGISQYRLPDEAAVLTGVLIRSTELTAEAEAILHVRGGIIDNLEIWSTDGYYADKEPTSYELRQVWKGSHGRMIKK